MHNFYRQFSMPPPPPPPQPSRRNNSGASCSQTHYDTLGISTSATAEEIKRAYRAASLKSHPDRNPSDPTAKTKFQTITAAYDVLSDPQKRAAYDAELNGTTSPNDLDDFMAFMMAMMASAPQPPSAHRQGPGMIFMTSPGMGHQTANPDELEEIFHQMYNNTPHTSLSVPNTSTVSQTTTSTHIPDPIIMTLEITMQDVFLGAQMPVQICRRVSKFRHAHMVATEQETVYIDVYRGIDDGEIITIPEKGHHIEGVYGDVKITIRVTNTTDFKRKGLDLIFTKRIGLREALGGEFEFDIKLLDDNTCTIKNKRGAVIEPNLCKTYAGMGLVRKDQKGNLIIRFIVDFPTTVNEEQLSHIAAAFT